MMMRLALAGLLLAGSTGVTVAGRYGITAHEKRACRSDAIRLCAYTFPSERRLLTCMKAHKAQLGGHCRRVFARGVARRGL